MHVITVVME